MKKYVIHTNTDGTKSYVAWSDMFGLSYCGRRDMAGVVIFDTIEDAEDGVRQLMQGTYADGSPIEQHCIETF